MTGAGAGVRIPVILNASAGLQRTEADRIADRLGRDVVRVRAVAPQELEAAVRAAAGTGAPIIGVAGGDGTLRTAAGILAGTDTVLLCVPAGTLNHFARRIGIDDLDAAAAALAARRVEAQPLGTVQDDVFLNTLTFGEYSRIVRLRERFRGAVGKWPAAVAAFGITLLTLRRIGVRLRTPDEMLVLRTPFVWIGVGWGSFPRVHEALERRTVPDLEVTVLRPLGAAARLAFLIRLGARMMRGRQPVRDRALEVLHTQSLALDSAHRLDATADGEVLRLKPPVQVGVRPAALRVLVGPGAGGGPPAAWK